MTALACIFSWGRSWWPLPYAIKSLVVSSPWSTAALTPPMSVQYIYNRSFRNHARLILTYNLDARITASCCCLAYEGAWTNGRLMIC